MGDYKTGAEPRAMIGDIPVFCAYDELLDIGKAVPNPKNPNHHPDSQIELLAKIIKAQGWRQPITISNRSGLIVKGHGRLLAAIRLNADQVPVDFQNYATEAEEIADLTADNRLAELAEMENDALADILQEIDTDEFPIELTGYTQEEFEQLLDGMTTMDEEIDDSEDDFDGTVPVEPKAKRGDIYILGRHRLMCGDSTSVSDMDELMDGETAEICFTSPPYNASSLNVKGNKTTEKKYLGYDDNKTEDEYFQFISDNVALMLTYATEVFYNIGLVEGSKRSIIRLQNEFIQQFKDIIYWKKNTVAPHIQPGVINNLVEFILCFGNGHRAFEHAQFSQGTYWNVIEGSNASGNEYSDIHKATFPVYLPVNIIENFSSPDAIVIDCFGGTGTTMIACEKTGRQCRMMEIEPAYVDVIIARWENLTGQKAVLINGKDPMIEDGAKDVNFIEAEFYVVEPDLRGDNE